MVPGMKLTKPTMRNAAVNSAFSYARRVAQDHDRHQRQRQDADESPHVVAAREPRVSPQWALDGRAGPVPEMAPQRRTADEARQEHSHGVGGHQPCVTGADQGDEDREPGQAAHGAAGEDDPGLAHCNEACGDDRRGRHPDDEQDEVHPLAGRVADLNRQVIREREARRPDRGGGDGDQRHGTCRGRRRLPTPSGRKRIRVLGMPGAQQHRRAPSQRPFPRDDRPRSPCSCVRLHPEDESESGEHGRVEEQDDRVSGRGGPSARP